jgi:hypothetical protein
MTWTVAAVTAIHGWRCGAHARLLRQHAGEHDAERVVEELVSGLAANVAMRAETLAIEDQAARVTARHVEVAAQQVNLRVRVIVERGLRPAA